MVQQGRTLTSTSTSTSTRPAGFAVLDLETTGLSPARDRVVEVAVVHVDPDGRVGQAWTTLVHPGQAGTGRSDLHGITPDDVRAAPRFADVLPELVPLLDGRVVAAHNARFDLPFLRAELQRCGVAMPEVAHLCTLQASFEHLPGLSRRRLSDCCEHVGVPLDDAHEALADATATAHLLAWYLTASRTRRGWADAVLAAAGDVTWPAPAAPAGAGRLLPRPRSGSPRPVPAAAGRFAALLADLPLDSPDLPLPEAAGYLEVLASAMADGVLTDAEVEQLAVVASGAGLSRTQVDAAHRGTLLALARAAVADGVVSRLERRDLLATAVALGLPEHEVGAVLDEASTERRGVLDAATAPLPVGWAHGEPLRVGEGVVFTGGDGVGRARLELRARAAGLRVTGSVSRSTSMLVTDDVASGTAKARRALELGTRVVDLVEFAVLVEHVQPCDRQVRVPAPRAQVLSQVRAGVAAATLPPGDVPGAGPSPDRSPVYPRRVTDQHDSGRDAPPPAAPEPAAPEPASAYPPPVGQQPQPLPPPYPGPPPAAGARQDLARYGPPPVPPPPVGHYYASAYPAVPSPLKDVGVAYLLWFLLGGFGGHHFYLRHPGRGSAMLVVALLGWLTTVVGIGFLLLVGVFLWWVVDAFLMPERIRRLNHSIAVTNGVAQQQHGYPR